jgi:heptose-I-phosphate ethanolaminephosphotransferase
MTFHDFRRLTAICVLETAFWAPFFFLPLAASVMVDIQPSSHIYAHALYGTAAFAVVGAYFRRYFLAIRLSAFVVLGLGTFITTGIVLAGIAFADIDGDAYTHTMLAIIDTSAGEADEFVKGNYGVTGYLLEALLLFPLIPLVIQWRKRLMWRPPNAVPGLIVVLLSVLFIVRRGILDFPFMVVAAALPAPLPVYFAAASALHERAEISAIGVNGAPIESVTVVERRHEPRTYVVVIGEAESKYHMHLYGYRRPTTPHLDAMVASHELLVFSNVVTSHAQTVPALIDALTVSVGRQKERRTIIDILNEAGFKTYWLSNQSSGSGWDSAVKLLSHSATEHQWVRKGGADDNVLPQPRTIANYFSTIDRRNEVDGALLPYLHDVLARKDEDKVVFVHLIGNHYDYRFRYPPEEKTFSDLKNPGCFSASEAVVVNNYDNSVRYTDLILSRIVDATRNAGGESFVLYFSDHGEEVYDFRNYVGHGDTVLSPYLGDVPLLLWLSPRYLQYHPIVAASAGASLNRPFWTGDLSYALADLARVNFPGMDMSRSFFSDQFKMRTRLTAGLDYDAFRDAWRPDTAHADRIALNACATTARKSATRHLRLPVMFSVTEGGPTVRDVDGAAGRRGSHAEN